MEYAQYEAVMVILAFSGMFTLGGVWRVLWCIYIAGGCSVYYSSIVKKTRIKR